MPDETAMAGGVPLGFDLPDPAPNWLAWEMSDECRKHLDELRAASIPRDGWRDVLIVGSGKNG